MNQANNSRVTAKHPKKPCKSCAIDHPGQGSEYVLTLV
jgi:hypothetical protein